MAIRNAAIITGAAAMVSLAACGGPSAQAAPSSSAHAQAAKATAPTAHHRRHHSTAALHHRRNRRRAATGLAAIHDPATVTGTLTGGCRTRDRGLLPDPSCTPGAIDPAVTQANIGSTICRAGYTDSVRPPESQTEAFKWGVAEPAYGQHDMSGELDHLVPLDLGGDNDARNLWVEQGPIPNLKDAVENALNHAVCDGRITLRAAQREIARNWVKAAASVGISVPRPGGSPPAGRSAWCTATASYNSRYADWDVYVHSNQPDATVSARSANYTHSWHTDASGYADVYLRGPSAGQTITVTVGAADCHTTAG